MGADDAPHLHFVHDAGRAGIAQLAAALQQAGRGLTGVNDHIHGLLEHRVGVRLVIGIGPAAALLYSYVVDAVDTVTAKIEIIMRAQAAGVPVISCMGAGNKLDPTQFHVADIYKTTMCPLAKVMRHELKKRGVKKLKVVYSTEKPVRPLEDMSESCRSHCVCPPGTEHKCTERRDIPGSVAFVPPVAGLILAGEVIKDLTKDTIVR